MQFPIYRASPDQSWYIPNPAKTKTEMPAAALMMRGPKFLAEAKRKTMPPEHKINVL